MINTLKKKIKLNFIYDNEGLNNFLTWGTEVLLLLSGHKNRTGILKSAPQGYIPQEEWVFVIFYKGTGKLYKIKSKTR